MKVVYIHHYEIPETRPLYEDILRLRAKVFKDRLEWDVETYGEFEIDVFDACKPTYLAAVNDERAVIGCVRLLPCTGPTMLADTFPQLLGELPMPRSEGYYESSRFCVDTERAAEVGRNGLRQATHVMFAGMIEWGLEIGIDAIVTVTDTRLERIAARAGWPVDRLAEPQRIDTTIAVAGKLEISQAALQRVLQSGGLPGPVLSMDLPVLHS